MNRNTKILIATGFLSTALVACSPAEEQQTQSIETDVEIEFEAVPQVNGNIESEPPEYTPYIDEIYFENAVPVIEEPAFEKSPSPEESFGDSNHTDDSLEFESLDLNE